MPKLTLPWSVVRLSILALLLVASSTETARSQSYDGAPDTLSFQGRLTDAGGTPVSDATYSVTFALYDTLNGGSSIWTETQSISTIDGGFQTMLGRSTTLADVPFSDQLFLGIKINSDPEMTRQPMASAPYALSLRNLRVIPETATNGPNIIGGWSGNSVSSGIKGATISGGGGDDPSEFLTTGPNRVTDDYGTVGGGYNNWSKGLGTVGGGFGNVAGGGATVGGGVSNVADQTYATIGGGAGNESTAVYATVSGGKNNDATAEAATVVGGELNTASGMYATIAGGLYNRAEGNYSFAAGNGAKADHDGTFVWNGSDNEFFEDSLRSSGINQFLIGAPGGVGIGTNAPLSPLHLEVVDINLGSPAIYQDDLIIEDTDAMLSLYSNTGGSAGSGIQLGEIVGGSLTNKWAMFRKTTGANGSLSLTYGKNPNYASNGLKVEIDTTGAITASDYKLSSPTSRLYQRPVSAFKARGHFENGSGQNGLPFWVEEFGYIDVTQVGVSASSVTFDAPVDLPAGAKLTGMKLWLFDYDAENAETYNFSLYRRNTWDSATSGVSIGHSFTGAGASSSIFSEDISFAGYPVQNVTIFDNAMYWLSVTISNPVSGIRFYGMTIEYEVDTVSP